MALWQQLRNRAILKSNEDAWTDQKAAAGAGPARLYFCVAMWMAFELLNKTTDLLESIKLYTSSSLVLDMHTFAANIELPQNTIVVSTTMSYDKFQMGPGVQATKLLSSTLSLLSAFLARYEIRPGEGPIVVRLADGEENSLALQSKSTISFSIVRTTEDNRGQQRTAEYYFCALISPNFAMLNGP